MTVAQLAVAWALSRGDEIVALVGASRPERIADALIAADLVLTDADRAAIDEAVPDGAVYRYFPSKAALREAVTRRWLTPATAS